MTRCPTVIRRPVKLTSLSHLRTELKKAANDSRPPAAHPYDLARHSRNPLDFAEFILDSEHLIQKVRGVTFVNGRQSSLLVKMQEANRVLKRLGLRQIANCSSWCV